VERIHANGSADIAKMQIAKIDHVDLEIIAKGIIAKLLRHGARNDNATRRRIGLKTCGNVDAVAIDVVFFQDDVRSIQPHTKADALISGQPRCMRSYCFLQ
jgi:hypothetical protein